MLAVGNCYYVAVCSEAQSASAPTGERGTGHTVAAARLQLVEHYVAGGSTVNVCSLDLSKAFDKMNNFALYLKLMDRSVPVQLLSC